MRISVAVILVAGIAFGSGLTAAPLMGPKGGFSTLLFRLEYDPSKNCSKPLRPYGNDRYAWDSYKSDAARYIRCMQEAAEADMSYASAVIADGYKEKVAEFRREVERGY